MCLWPGDTASYCEEVKFNHTQYLTRRERSFSLSLEAIFSSLCKRRLFRRCCWKKRRIWFKTIEHTVEVTHLSHLELAWGESTEKGVTQKEYKAEKRGNFLRWFRLINLFSPHHLSATQGFVPREPPNYTRAPMCVWLLTSVFVYMHIESFWVYVCVFVSRTPERHKRLMYCHESTDAVVRDCVPQSCDQALCVCACADLCWSKAESDSCFARELYTISMGKLCILQ